MCRRSNGAVLSGGTSYFSVSVARVSIERPNLSFWSDFCCDIQAELSRGCFDKVVGY
jgi:hypothetical protein